MRFSIFSFMSGRFARGAAIVLFLLALAFAAWLLVSYNSQDAKMARWKISVEKEIKLQQDTINIFLDSVNFYSGWHPNQGILAYNKAIKNPLSSSFNSKLQIHRSRRDSLRRLLD